MQVFNNVTNSPISLNMGETKTIKLNVPDYTTNVRLCTLRPNCTLDIISNIGNAASCYLFLQYPYGMSGVTIKIDGEIREISKNAQCLYIPSGGNLLEYSLTPISEE